MCTVVQWSPKVFGPDIRERKIKTRKKNLNKVKIISLMGIRCALCRVLK
jgi:hypothetical protein